MTTYMLIEVYRGAKHEGCGKLSDIADWITVVNVRGGTTLEPNDERPAFELVRHHYYGDIPILIPVDLSKFAGMRGPMAGGNYAGGSCDARWTEAVQKIAGKRGCELVQIFDGFEAIYP